MRAQILPVIVMAALTCTAVAVRAQETINLKAEGDPTALLVRGYSGDPETAPPVMQATWRSAPEAATTFTFQRLSAPGNGLRLAVDELVLAGVEQYLDQRIHFVKNGVRTDVAVERMVSDIEAMVRTASAEFGGPDFIPLSQATREQLARVSKIDWSQARFGVDGGDDQDKYLAIYYYVRTQRQELERQLRADMLPLETLDVLRGGAETKADPGRTLVVPTVCRTVFDDQNYLCALDLTMGDTQGAVVPDARLTDQLMANIAAKAKEEAAAGSGLKMRKRDRWLKTELDGINQRIDKLDQRKELWALRDRMDSIEGHINDLDAQVADLRNGGTNAAAHDNPIARLSDLTGHNITIRFTKGSMDLDAEYRTVLNEVFEQLARSRQDRVLITGYTDRSGDALANLALSEQRAKAVRAYLMQRGISGERLLLNYYGDRHSTGPDPQERRVELEWLH